MIKGTIEDDQMRRDFTINAMSIRLNKNGFGEFIDPFNGLSDIKNKIIRTPLNPVKTYDDEVTNDIVIEFDASEIGDHGINFIAQLPDILKDSGEIGKMEYDIIEESEFYETLGGLIAYKIGEIPKKGNKLNIGNYIIKIKKVTLTKIDRITIEVNEEE